MPRGFTGDSSCSPGRERCTCAAEATKRKGKKGGLIRKSGTSYLKPGFIYSPQAVTSNRWQKRRERRGNCGEFASPDWSGGVRMDDRRWASPVRCHQREHDGCRPSECEERIIALNPVSFLTLTDRLKSQKDAVRDWRFGAVGRRLHRFLGLLRKWLGSFLYVWVRECHETGFPHIHIAMDLRVPCLVTEMRKNSKGRWVYTGVACPCVRGRLSEFWRACGGGWSCRWERVRNPPAKLWYEWEAGAWVKHVSIPERDPRGTARYLASYLGHQERQPEAVQALVAVNKLRDWSASKGIRPARTDLPWAVSGRGTAERSAEYSQLEIGAVRAELAERRETTKATAIEKERKRQARMVG